jgi:hypothetical protein
LHVRLFRIVFVGLLLRFAVFLDQSASAFLFALVSTLLRSFCYCATAVPSFAPPVAVPSQ